MTKNAGLNPARERSLWGLWLPIAVAFALWFAMFSPFVRLPLPFWWAMTISAVTLTSLATVFNSGWWRNVRIGATDVALGVGIAAALWGVFWVGDKLSSLLFGFARPQVDLIYGMKNGFRPWLISLLLLLVIGPAEEIFWRGHVQKTLSERLGRPGGFVAATALYAGVHIPSLNFMLVMASLVAGLAWGFIYMRAPQRLGALIVSHALWDAAVFVWFPI